MHLKDENIIHALNIHVSYYDLWRGNPAAKSETEIDVRGTVISEMLGIKESLLHRILLGVLANANIEPRDRGKVILEKIKEVKGV